MIITRAPFRVSFCGGGSDLPSFYEKYGGCVLSTTIRKYMYLTIHNYFEKDQIVLKYSKTEIVHDYSEIEHRIFKQCLSDFGLKGVELSSMADIPAGTGLGSSVLLLSLCYSFLIPTQGSMYLNTNLQKMHAQSKSRNSVNQLENKTSLLQHSVGSGFMSLCRTGL